MCGWVPLEDLDQTFVQLLGLFRAFLLERPLGCAGPNYFVYRSVHDLKGKATLANKTGGGPRRLSGHRYAASGYVRWVFEAANIQVRTAGGVISD